jgi:RNA polymerase sigma factor (sigma-70 family)
MAQRHLNHALCFIHRFAGLHVHEERTDRQLLESFAAHGDQASFDALVRRHGRLVSGVCRRVLQNDHDAEDAFQATFLVLSRKAASISWHESVKHWLYEVAYRVALRARAHRQRRQAQERQAAAACHAGGPGEVSWREVQLALDEELQRLPAKYRAPLLLCYLEGHTQEEAARQLGWSPGAVRGRLWRGRDLLRARLARRGLELSVVLLASLLANNAPAAVPGALLTATVNAGVRFAAGQASSGLVSAEVLNLTQGVLKAMFLTKLKLTVAIVLGLGLLGTTAGAIAQRALIDRPAPAAAVLAEPQNPAPRAVNKPANAPETSAVNAFGVVKAVDADKSTLTLTIQERGKGATEQTLALAKDLKVVLDDGTAIKLADVAAGMAVGVKLSDDKKSVSLIRINRPVEGGQVKAVDADKKTITLAGRGEDRKFSVAADAKITIRGKEGKLADVKEGMPVSLRLSLDRKTVLSIQVANALGQNPQGQNPQGPALKPLEKKPEDKK